MKRASIRWFFYVLLCLSLQRSSPINEALGCLACLVQYSVLTSASIASITEYGCTTPLQILNHAGTSVHNFLVADYLSIMLCNSSGLTIGDLEPFVEAEDQYRLSPEDIFGLGCLLGEISIGLRPEIESIDQLWNIHDHLVSILDIVSRAGGYMERRTNMRASLGIPR